jgi:hypothetical protein
MSGGYFDYNQYSVLRIAEKIEHVISINDSTEIDQWGDPVGFGLSNETIAQMNTALQVLRLAFIYARRVDWLLSGDDSEESFHRRLADELSSPSAETSE